MDRITLIGKIHFDPPNVTKKHLKQSSWKKVAMVLLDGDICEYYSWFILKRYNLILNKPLRNAHITFINDKLSESTINKNIHHTELEKKWNMLVEKWEGKKVLVHLDINVRTNSEHWWLNIPHEERDMLQEIRNEIGLDKPYFGLHMSIGRAKDGLMMEHSKYIHNLIQLGFIQ